ncbi:HlyD family secretion protein [Croceicoccus ponticola]|uniref:HlyD family secretion protein n=1 Tax=Croceicoccus ponticola TaxID=2217664 RepID=A0A437GYK7_9SPHN|nr:HlyD family secretion protein [Croceicoccus ponticola]RVQ67762.1 HlyD family secretion protein [Croceicoccus ponticola]
MAEADPVTMPRADTQIDTPAPARSGWKRGLLMFGVPLLLLLGGLWYWFGSPGQVATDNAYLKLDIVSVASEVPGKIVKVNVRENQVVKKGDILFEIDPTSYGVAIAQADAQIASAQARITSLNAEVAATAADLAGARDDLALAQANYRREKELMDRGFNTRARMDAATHAVASARDQLASLQAEVEKAKAQLATGAQVPGVNPEVAAGRAAREKAQLDLERTVVRAPVAGRVTQVSRLQVGQSAMAALPMVSIVQDRGARVEANFKETDLAQMRPGQAAEIRIDAYPDLRLKGHVDSIGSGTGSEFSVLPAQNATGNWVKITQRVPVRISIDSQSDRPLISGLSADVTVFTDDE